MPTRNWAADENVDRYSSWIPRLFFLFQQSTERMAVEKSEGIAKSIAKRKLKHRSSFSPFRRPFSGTRFRPISEKKKKTKITYGGEPIAVDEFDRHAAPEARAAGGTGTAASGRPSAAAPKTRATPCTCPVKTKKKNEEKKKKRSS